MIIFNDVKLAKELIKFPSITPLDAGVMSFLEKKTSNLFKYISYYFPNTKIPRIITLTNNVYYQIKTVYSDSLLLISLDTFLGSDHPLYEGIPYYIRKELDSKYLLSQIAEKFASYVIPPNENRTFLSNMVYEGKKLYLQDLILPNEEDKIKRLAAEKQASEKRLEDAAAKEASANQEVAPSDKAPVAEETPTTDEAPAAEEASDKDGETAKGENNSKNTD